jgi:hypothetical protein
MALVDRSKEDAKVDNQLGKQQNGNRTNQLKIKEGNNLFRLLPANPEFEEASSIETKVVRFLPHMKKDRDANGKELTGKDGQPILVETVKPVWDGRVHGGAPIDAVDEYEKIAKRISEQTYEKEADRANFMAPILGNKMKGGKFQGIAPRQTWVAYAYAIGKEDVMTFGELEFGKAVRQAINRIAGTEQGADDAMATDACFTDIDEGRGFKVTYNKEAKRL